MINEQKSRRVKTNSVNFLKSILQSMKCARFDLASNNFTLGSENSQVQLGQLDDLLEP